MTLTSSPTAKPPTSLPTASTGARCRPTGRTGAPQEAVRGFAPPTKDGDRPLKPRRSLSERWTASAPKRTPNSPHGGILGAASGAAIGAAAGGGPGAALGAAIGGATGIFGGVASTPPPPPGTYFGYPVYGPPGYGYPGYAQPGYGYPGYSRYPAYSGPPAYEYQSRPPYSPYSSSGYGYPVASYP